MQNTPWHRWLPNLFLFTGGMLLLWAVLAVIKPILASPQSLEGNYLRSSSKVSLPLPQFSSIRSTEPAPEDVFFSLVHSPYTPTPTPTLTPTPIPVGPVVRLRIPSINVDRAVVPLRQYRDGNGVIQYDTDSLFASSSRLDLVGQTLTSVNPGGGSNIVLVGHNYNRGWFAWEGIFVNLNKLKPGDKIDLFTKDGGNYTYFVKKVSQVPWTSRSASEINKHLNYLGPTSDERVTLVTCGGAFGVWTVRVYVVAK